MSPIVVAFDVDSLEAVAALADKLDPTLCRAKVGKELFTRCGPAAVEVLHQRGFEVFLDLKFHDIPNTVAGAVRSAAELGVWMVNVHASGGPKMMAAAREALNDFAADAPLLIAVTVLTSMDEAQLAATGVVRSPAEQVSHLAALAADSGMDGVVCSAQEASGLSQQCGSDFVLVTPGIRPADASVDDQHRVMTPADAMAAGSHYLVIGRPISQHAEPKTRLAEIAASL